MLLLCLIRAPLLRHAPCPTQISQSSIMSQPVSSDYSDDPDSESDAYQKLFDALKRDFKYRKIFTKQSTAKKPAELWSMQESEASCTDLDNNFESLKVIVATIPYAVASVTEIKSMLIKIDSGHQNVLSAATEKKSQNSWAAGEAQALWGLWSYLRTLWRKAPKNANSKRVESLKALMVKQYVQSSQSVQSSPHSTKNSSLRKYGELRVWRSSPVRVESKSPTRPSRGRSPCSQSPRRPSRGQSPLNEESECDKAMGKITLDGEGEDDTVICIPKPPKPGERPKPGHYRDEDEIKASLRSSQEREENKKRTLTRHKTEVDSSDEDCASEDSHSHLPQPKRVKWDNDVEVLGKSPPCSPVKIQKKPAKAKDEGNISDADTEDVSVCEREGTTPSKKNIVKPKTTPPPPPKRSVVIKVGDKKWEVRWKTLLSKMPKECMPQSSHGEANWTVTDSDATTSIQVQAKNKCFYVVKTKVKYKGPKNINVVRDFAGNYNKAWSDLKKKTGWSGISQKAN